MKGLSFLCLALCSAVVSEGWGGMCFKLLQLIAAWLVAGLGSPRRACLETFVYVGSSAEERHRTLEL